MPIYMEVVAELSGKGFANSGQVTTGKIMKVIPQGPFLCDVEEAMKGVAKPDGEFASIEDAKTALIKFWDDCDKALQKSGMPSWQKRTR